MRNLWTRIVLLGTSSLVSVGAAIAQDQTETDNGPKLETIVVTAQSRQESLQDVPVSVSAVDSETISARNLSNVENLTDLAPNFTYTETGIATSFFLRGIGSGINQGFEQSVGVYVDGINFPRGQQVRAPFFDVERIEVLRGPQSILFGKNSVAGAISVVSAKPTDSFEGSMLGSYEFLDGESLIEGVVSGPLSDRVRARVAARFKDADGYLENTTLNQDEPQKEELSIRGTLEFDVTDNLLATLKAEVSRFDSVGRHIQIDNSAPAVAGPFAGLHYGQILASPLFNQHPSVLNVVQDDVRSSNGDNSNNDSQNYQLVLDYDLNGFELKATSNFQNFEYDELADVDYTGADVLSGLQSEEYSQFSQEFRLTSPKNDRFDYILGAYYQSSDHEYAADLNIAATSVLVPVLEAASPGAGLGIAGTGTDRLSTADSKVLSVFAQGNVLFNDDWSLQLGGRVTRDERDGFRRMIVTALGGGDLPASQAAAAPLTYAALFQITSTNLEALGPFGAPFVGALGEGQVSASFEKTSFSPDVKLVYTPSDDVMMYASWTRGSKAGGFDFLANNKGSAATFEEGFVFDEEIASNYEVGGKFSFGGNVELNAAAYFTQFEDLQISIFDGALGFNVGNAAESEIFGLELDGRWAVTDHLRLSGAFAYTDFEFTDFKNGQCYFGQTPDFANGLCDYTGKSNQLVSEFAGNLTADFDIPLGERYELAGLTALNFASDYDASITFDPLGKENGYVEADLRLAFRPVDRKWEFAVLGENLTDNERLTLNGDAPLAGSTFGSKTTYGLYTRGRKVSAQFKVHF
ncbi:TonB-dependent receptor [Hirschia maritima]|uniref:TonB-dependent receptor n=1 Tax=Hirschia maritima TaxID=1121961 RepID=UPI00036AD5C5|nr:TonB-dependent receptor [Hirschia maritima]